MKRAFVAVGLAIWGCATHSPAQGTSVTVTANPLWTDTGISVTNGESIDIQAFGVWAYNTNEDSGPDGWDVGSTADTFLGNNIRGSLIAYIGADPYQGHWHTGFFPQTNGYYEIGTSRQFLMGTLSSTNGELWLGINDDAVSGSTNDNSGYMQAEVFLNYGSTNNATFPPPTLGGGKVGGTVKGNNFSFVITNGPANTLWFIEASSDLINWVLASTVTLDSSGSNIFKDPITGVSDQVTGVPYRFYRALNGMVTSHAYGFIRLTVGPATYNTNSYNDYYPGTNALIADQLIAPDNSLNGLFASGMPDGTFLPSGTEIWFWNDGAEWGNHVWNGSSWSPEGTDKMLPGSGAMLVVPPTNGPLIVTFVGTVLDGTLTTLITNKYGSWCIVSSQVPQAGGLDSNLGYLATNGDEVDLWEVNSYSTSIYDTVDYPQPTWTNTGGYPIPEPVLQVGQAFLLAPVGTNTETWVRSFSPRSWQ